MSPLTGSTTTRHPQFEFPDGKLSFASLQSPEHFSRCSVFKNYCQVLQRVSNIAPKGCMTYHLLEDIGYVYWKSSKHQSSCKLTKNFCVKLSPREILLAAPSYADQAAACERVPQLALHPERCQLPGPGQQSSEIPSRNIPH
eukprot:3948004-Amphidinium_carterae.2